MDDTLLTAYKPSDFTAAVQAKSISVHPWPAIMVRGFGQDTDGDEMTVVFSGWMDSNAKGGPGPGYRLWKGTAVLGSKDIVDVPVTDGKWDGLSGSIFEVDTWTAADDKVTPEGIDDVGGTPKVTKHPGMGAIVLDSALALGAANQEACLILPTLGYSRILIEVDDLDVGNEVLGIIWRPLPLALFL